MADQAKPRRVLSSVMTATCIAAGAMTSVLMLKLVLWITVAAVAGLSDMLV